MIEVAKMVDQHSFFVNPSRNERNRHKGEFTPTEVMNTLMGHIIGGRGRTRVMGTSIKSRDSAIVRLDLSNTPSDEGRSPLSTFASFLHTNGAMVMCTSKDGALVTFNAFGQGGKQEAHPKSPPTMVSLPPPMPSRREPNKVDVQAPNTTSLFDIQCAGGLLGPFTRFELHSRSENPPISFYSVTYEKLQSAQIATGLAMGPISFHLFHPYLQVDALLRLDPSVAEEDRPAEAGVRAGLNIGAGAFLKDYIVNYKEHQTSLRPPRRPPRQEDQQTENLTDEDLPGLRIIEDAIDMTIEATLMAYLEKQEWERQTRGGKLHYGWKYVDASHTLKRAEELPTELMNLTDNLMDAKDSEDIPLLAVQPNQVSVNDYEPGVGIGWHKDIDDLGDTITWISLMGTTTMEFRKGNGPVVSVQVPRYSAL